MVIKGAGMAPFFNPELNRITMPGDIADNIQQLFSITIILGYKIITDICDAYFIYTIWTGVQNLH